MKLDQPKDSNTVLAAVTFDQKDQKAFLAFVKLYYGDAASIAKAMGAKGLPPAWVVKVVAIIGKLAIQVAGHDWVFEVRKDNVFNSRFSSKGVVGPEKKINEKLDELKQGEDAKGMMILVLGFQCAYMNLTNQGSPLVVYAEYKKACDDAKVEAETVYKVLLAGCEIALKQLG